VEDTAAILAAILSSDATAALNVASGHGLSLREEISLICAKNEGAGLTEFDALPAPAGDPEHVVANVPRLVREVGWRPAYTIEIGIDHAIAAWHPEVGQERNT
jgi:UDP-glucuronate decarboxylase